MRPVRAIVIGCVEFSWKCLELVLNEPGTGIEVAGVVTKEKSAMNSDFVSLGPLAESRGLPTFVFTGEGREDRLSGWVRDMKPALILVLGWSHLLPEALFRVPSLGTIGFHPALLPRNRGRHPLIWSLALGLRKTGSTFFLISGIPDGGPILSQREIQIDPSDDAGSLYAKVEAVALDQLRDFLPRYVSGRLAPEPQDESMATFWRKRGKTDGEIDWRMSARTIHNLVRALAPPYPGAHFLFDGREVRVRKSRVREGAPEDREPGYVLAVEGRSFSVKCGEGALVVEDCDLPGPLAEGTYL